MVSANPQRGETFPLRSNPGVFVATGFLCLVVAYALVSELRLNGGVFTYGRDDAYIHMAIARNLALHHVWGITRYGFVSASSSPLWTSLVAITDWIFGVSDKSPLILSFLSAIALLWSISRLMARNGLGRGAITVTLLAIVFVMPLPYLVLDGMEPALHTTFTIWFLYLAGETLNDKRSEARCNIELGVLAMFLVGARFEGIFLVALTAGLLVLQRRYIAAIVITGLAAVPILALGIPSVWHGGWVLPNSVMLKGTGLSRNLSASGVTLATTAFVNLRACKTLLVIVLLAIVAALGADPSNRQSAHRLRLALFISISFLHLAFAQIGNPFRYEAYLIATGIVLIALSFKEPGFQRLLSTPFVFASRSSFSTVATTVALTVVIVLISLPLLGRGAYGMIRADRASHNCFEQQYQIARFIHRFYQGQTVVLSDIGFVSYFDDVRVIDSTGLGSNEIAHNNGRAGGEILETSAHNERAKIAIVYPAWIPHVPKSWTKVGEWELHDITVSLGGRTVVFYATCAAQVELIRHQLDDFRSELPREVEARIFDDAQHL